MTERVLYDIKRIIAEFFDKTPFGITWIFGLQINGFFVLLNV